MDKFVAIHWPMRYKRVVTKKKTICVSLLINGYGLIISVVPLAGFNQFFNNDNCSFVSINHRTYINYLSAMILVCVSFTISLYLILGRTAMHQIQKTASARGISLRNRKEDTNKHRISLLRIELKILHNLAIVVGALASTCIPFAVYLFLSDREGQPLLQNSSVISKLRSVSLVLLILNSAINPLIYALKFPQFSRAFRIVLHIDSSQ